MYSAFATWGTLNSRRAISPLVRLVEGEERWEAPDHHQGVLPCNWGGSEQNRTVTCMVLKATDNDRLKNLPLAAMNFAGLDLMVLSSVPLRHGGTLNSHRAASPLVWLMERKERWEVPDHPQGYLSLSFGVEPSKNVLSPAWCFRLTTGVNSSPCLR
ncbi:uncharacterized protein TNCV_1981061 [Trichonephila clavipes]|nr:uncharacterized protein TNCV_1981061 [Trichonephila clavipes]